MAARGAILARASDLAAGPPKPALFPPRRPQAFCVANVAVFRMGKRPRRCAFEGALQAQKSIADHCKQLRKSREYGAAFLQPLLKCLYSLMQLSTSFTSNLLIYNDFAPPSKRTVTGSSPVGRARVLGGIGLTGFTASFTVLFSFRAHRCAGCGREGSHPS